VDALLLWKKRYLEYTETPCAIESQDIISETKGYLWKPFYFFIRYEVRWININEICLASNDTEQLVKGEIYEIIERKFSSCYGSTCTFTNGITTSTIKYIYNPSDIYENPVNYPLERWLQYLDY